ncbi:MAG: hypothetical protein KatS3mg065_0646 [Chloroflexota bacterium]|nr:MAG: hypothetical protein KatS3mg065_0646 [Chloroflexota bacterium]
MSVTGPRLQPTLAELSRPGRGGYPVPHPPSDALDRIPAEHRRPAPPGLPELAEPEVVRHFVNLSQLNHAVDTGFYPLGSCTMKYNPKLGEWAARLPGLRPPPPVRAGRGSPRGPSSSSGPSSRPSPRSAAWRRSPSSRRPERRAS